MARITIEDCLEHVSDHFALVHLAAKRYRQLHTHNVIPLVEVKNKPAVVALREVASGQLNFRENISEAMNQQMIDAQMRNRRSQRLESLVNAEKLRSSLND